MKKLLLAVLASGLWINGSEFVRNELLFKDYWMETYASLGMVFPSSAPNNLLWATWGFLLAVVIVFLARKLSFFEILLATWVPAFLLMWIVVGNLNVLPLGLLPIAMPWSVVEVAVAVVVAGKIVGVGTAGQLFSGRRKWRKNG